MRKPFPFSSKQPVKTFPALLLLCLSGLAYAADVDRVTVDKSERIMRLHAGDTIVKEVAISLGDAPEGHKQREGDEKTPEGRYVLDWRNPNSSYHRSIHISYPNEADKAHARKNGYSPGGDIFIHGLPNGMGQSGRLFRGRDWTDGCIAVNNNDDMTEIWNLVRNGTPIEITP